jgi:hypothetical protein
MQQNVLVLNTNYDFASQSTSHWAKKLQQDLFTQGHTCLLLDTTALCQGGATLQNAISCVDYIVYFGHGSIDEWIALPALGNNPTVPLVDSNTVNLLMSRKIYACCCWSISGLGKAYSNQFSNGEYIGYDQPFSFEKENEVEFQNAVINSAIAFINGNPARIVVQNLRQKWVDLEYEFSQGSLNWKQNAIFAASAAHKNSRGLQHLP